MIFETKRDKEAIRKWAALAMQLNGAADSGKYEHITTAVVVREAMAGTAFQFLAREVGTDVDLTKLDDKDRHVLSKTWRSCAAGYDPQQFHIARSGLALLVGYLLHLILNSHVDPPE